MGVDFLSMLIGSFAMPAENPTVAMVEAAYRHPGIQARYRLRGAAGAARRPACGEGYKQRRSVALAEWRSLAA